MKVPKSLNNLIESFEKLPGIGHKTAQRLTFYLLHMPEYEVAKFSESLLAIKQNIKLCQICKNVTEESVCSICNDDSRDKNLIAVVSGPLDLFALERTGFKGVYHVLHGVIDPLNNIGPDDIYLNDLINRIRNSVEPIELILATNTNIEGESTSMYISKLIKDLNLPEDPIKISRIARGLPVGGDLEYADDITLKRALEGRSKF